jgi:hypothetical protein
MKKYFLFFFILILFFQKDTILRTLHFSGSIIQLYQQSQTELTSHLTIDITQEEFESLKRNNKELIWKGAYYEIISTQLMDNNKLHIALHADHWETQVYQWIETFNQTSSSDLPLKGVEKIKWWVDQLPFSSLPSAGIISELTSVCSSSYNQHYSTPFLGIELPPPNL